MLKSNFDIRGAALHSYNGSNPIVRVPAGVEYIFNIYNGPRTHCDFIKRIELPSTVTHIQEGALENCRYLESISIPCGIKEIGTGAFSGCERLKRVSLWRISRIEGYLFDGCTSLEKIHIPKGVTKIGECAFRNCKHLESIEIPEGTKTICAGAFQGCIRLKRVKLPSTIREIRANAFEGCVSLTAISIPTGADLIDKTAFLNTGVRQVGSNGFFIMNKTLVDYVGDEVDIEIPAKIKEIGNSVFAGKHILSVEIPDGVKVINAFAFKNCQELERVRLPEGLEELGFYTFKDCRSLEEISLPASLRRMYDGAFEGCDRLNSIELPSGLEYCGTGAFAGCLSLEEIDLPNSLICISTEMLSGCKSLKDITIPSSVEKIEKGALSRCDALTSVKIPDTVKSINENALQGCQNLMSVEISEQSELTYIGGNAFANCPNLTRIVIPPRTKIIGTNAFCKSDVKDITLFALPRRGRTIFNGCPVPERVRCHADILGISIGDLDKAFSNDNDMNNIYVLKLSMSALADIGIESITDSELLRHISESPEVFSPLAIKCLDERELAAYISILNRVSPSILDYFIDLATEAGRSQIGAFLLEYKRAHYTAEQLIKYESEALDKSLGIREMTREDYEELFKIRYEGKRAKILKYIGREKTVEVPSRIDEYTVTDICKGSFKDCSVLEYVGLPDTIKSIGIEAFKDCKGLKSINLPIGVHVDDGAFIGCDSLGDKDGFFIVRGTLYHYSGTATAATIPGDVRHIHPYAFHSRTNLKELRVPGGIRVIAARTFIGTRLDDLYLTDSVKIMTWLSFNGDMPRSIHAPEGSYAEKFADENHIRFEAID